MRKKGKVVSWKDDKGFGFVEPAAGGKQLFVHIKAFPPGTRRPEIGTEVSYEETRDDQGRARAEDVRLLTTDFSFGSAAKAFIVAVLFLLIVAAVVVLGLLPHHVLWLYLGMSLVTFLFYAKDKSAAEKDAQRTPENTLQTLALLGGWPGALYAQQLLRHKTHKQPFRAVFYFMIALNVSGFVYLLSDYGRWLVQIFENMLKA